MTYMKRNNTNDKAVVCANNTCITVFGDTARVVNTLVLLAVFFVAAAWVAKALR